MRTEMPYGALVRRAPDQVWEVLTCGRGIDLLIGEHFAALLGTQRLDGAPAPMRLGERYALQGGTLKKEGQILLEVTALEPRQRYELRASAEDSLQGTYECGLAVSLSGEPTGTRVTVVPWIDFPAVLPDLIVQFGATLKDLFDLKSVDSQSLQVSLEDAILAPPAPPPSRIAATGAIAGIVAANIVAVAWMIIAGSSLAELLRLFWAENVALAAVTLIKIALARRIPGLAAKFMAALLFLCVFARFWEWQADVLQRVFPLPGFSTPPPGTEFWWPFAELQSVGDYFLAILLEPGGVGVMPILVLFSGHLYNLIFDYLKRDEYRYAHFGVVLREPALWLLVLQVGVTVGAVASFAFGAPAVMLWAILVLKIALELTVRRTWYRPG